MKKHCRILFATALFLIALVSCKEEALNLTSEAPVRQAQTRAAIEGLNANSMKVLSSTESSLVLELDVNNYAKNAVSIEGKDYFSITARDAHSMLQKGKPDLPEYAYSVVIPQTSACNVRVVNAEYEDITLPVAPSKGSFSRSVDPAAIPYTFSEVYEKDAFYPSQLVSADAPFLMRDIRGSVVRLHPFQYNPVTGILRVYKKMEVEVSFSGTDTRNVLTSGVRHTIDKSMEELFRAQFINYDVMAASTLNTLPPKKTGGDKGVKSPPPTEKMLIICCDSFATDMSMFMYYKNIRGITTRLVTMSQVGTSADDVATYIKEEDYDINENLKYVLLVGDAARVPTMLCEDMNRGFEGGADPSYALVEGSDSIPDIYIGRFSARNRSEVQTMVARSIYYENQSVQSWQHRSIGICDGLKYPTVSYYDYEHMDSIMTMLSNSTYGYGGIERLYDSPAYGSDIIVDPTTSDVFNAVNQGAFLIDYCGESYSSAWDTGSFDSSDVDLLQNDNKLPFVFCSGRDVGDFTGDCSGITPPCFAEKWLTASNSSTGAAIGAIGFFGCSIDPLWLEAQTAEKLFTSKLANGVASTFGLLCFFSTIDMVAQYGNRVNYILVSWNYFGDPSLAVIPNDYVPIPIE